MTVDMLPSDEEASLQGSSPLQPETCRKQRLPWKRVGVTIAGALLLCSALVVLVKPRVLGGTDGPNAFASLAAPSEQYRADMLRASNSLLPVQELYSTEQNWAATLCFVDSNQATFFLIQGAIAIDAAVKSCKGEKENLFQLNEEEQRACATAVSAVIASFAWVGSYLAQLASSCQASANKEAASKDLGQVCAADITWLIGELGEFATVGSGIADACSGLGPEPIIRDGKFHPPTLPPPPTIPPYMNVSNDMTPIQRIVAMNKRIVAMNKVSAQRGVDITTCIVAVDLAVTYLMRAATQIKDATEACKDPTSCAWSVQNVVSSFLWSAQFFAGIAYSCPLQPAKGAGCAVLVADFVATVASWGPLMAAIPTDCQPRAIGKNAGEGDRNGDI